MSDDPKACVPAETNQARHERFTHDHYQRWKRHDWISVSSAYGDAAHMCDAIAEDVCLEHTVRGKVTKEGLALAAAIKRAGDAIWAMRDMLHCRAPAAPEAPEATDG